MKTLLMLLFYLFVIAFVVFCAVWVHGLVKSKNLNFPKHYWIGLFGVQGCAICVNILNLIINFIK